MPNAQIRRYLFLLVLILLAATVWLGGHTGVINAPQSESQKVAIIVSLPPDGKGSYDEPRGGQPAPARSSASSEQAVGCMAEALYFEARSEGYPGMNAVAQTIKNRVSSRRWPGSVCGVISDPEQFSFLNDGGPDSIQDQKAWIKARRLAQVVLSGNVADPTFGATHYHADYVAPSWSQSQRLARTTTVGAHHFYRMSRVFERPI